ncbi:MAG: helix-hairpin-helix domain-containing protein [Terracidiphilus sp.]|nr:helix-hairpin-helix domain-containing protein [Terracidiphilus sp.]
MCEKAENKYVWTRRTILRILPALLCFTAVTGRAMSDSPSDDARVDLNTASMEQLMKLPGMTRVWAARIVKFRPYRRKDELVDRGVVTGEVYARIKDWVVAHRAKQ